MIDILKKIEAKTNCSGFLKIEIFSDMSGSIMNNEEELIDFDDIDDLREKADEYLRGLLCETK